MDGEKCSRSRQENGISESTAMERCQKSANVATIIESFSLADRVYIVTKFYKAGDMLHYLESQ